MNALLATVVVTGTLLALALAMARLLREFRDGLGAGPAAG